MVALLTLYAVLTLVAPWVGRRIGRRVLIVCAVAPAATLVWAATHLRAVVDDGVVTTTAHWVDDLGLSIDLRLDGFAMLMVALIAGVGVCIFVYSHWYFGDRPGLGRLAGILTAFTGSMFGVVVADNLLVLYVFWELTSVTSYLLIGFEDEKGSARAAALQAILVTAGGGLAMLGGFVLIAQEAGTYSLSAILASPPSGTAVGVGLVLVLVGAFTKSAHVPFHSWLPGAMAAPTPISAYLHSATMVKAGVYLIARFAPAFAAGYAFWRPLVVAVGTATMLLGGYRALRQHDLKLLLAFGTISQLGLMTVLVGSGYPELAFAGAAVILAHGLFKAAMFMVVGIVDHQAHSRDVRVLDGLGRRMPATFAVAAVAAASMAGVPPLLGFVTKEAAFEGLIRDAGAVVAAAIVVGSILTFAYGARFLWGAFATKPVAGFRDLATPTAGPVVEPPTLPFLAPAALLALLTVLLGLVPDVAGRLVAAAARALDPAAGHPHLYLWHGINTALALSVLTVAAGSILFVLRGHVENIQARVALQAGAQRVYELALVALNRVAARVTGIAQSGSLPIYIGVILLTTIALPGWRLVTEAALPDTFVVAESPLQFVVAALVLGAALAAAFAQRRFAAVLFLGAVGFGVAVLFVIQGAPDLALTQVLVETLALVIFVLVLRHLPERFAPVGWKLGNRVRLVIAGGVGVFITAFALIAATVRQPHTVSAEYLARSYPEGGGRNVVNVILTDFRAFDTLGEITVLLVAALGIASLVGARRRGGTDEA